MLKLVWFLSLPLRSTSPRKHLEKNEGYSLDFGIDSFIVVCCRKVGNQSIRWCIFKQYDIDASGLNLRSIIVEISHIDRHIACVTEPSISH